MTERQRQLLQLCAMTPDGEPGGWSVIARQAQHGGGLEALLDGTVLEAGAAAGRLAGNLRQGLRDPGPARRRAGAEVTAAGRAGARLVTVLDEEYPAGLRLVRDLPPFLFCRGDLRAGDALAVAVAGTREASEDGLRRAARMARLLAGHGVTVVSGLARGVDTAAHRAVLACGGRTVAVLGTGITRCYPGENRDLAEEIAATGALVSRFWPSRAPDRGTFPLRNAVASGMAQGTVVIEADDRSGARMQARIALGQEKKVFLLRSLAAAQPWAREYADRRGAVEVTEIGDVLRHLVPAAEVRWPTGQRTPPPASGPGPARPPAARGGPGAGQARGR